MTIVNGRKLLTVLVALLVTLLAGCSKANTTTATAADMTADSLKAFIKGCKSSVTAKLSLGAFGNSLELSCSELKPLEDEAKK